VDALSAATASDHPLLSAGTSSARIINQAVRTSGRRRRPAPRFILTASLSSLSHPFAPSHLERGIWAPQTLRHGVQLSPRGLTTRICPAGHFGSHARCQRETGISLPAYIAFSLNLTTFGWRIREFADWHCKLQLSHPIGMLDRAESIQRPSRGPGCSCSIVLARRLIGAPHDLQVLNVASPSPSLSRRRRGRCAHLLFERIKRNQTRAEA
jgi:hypothetical protein